MKIRSIQTTIIEIPFIDGGKGEGLTPTAWRTLETVLVRIEDEDGFIGWGEGFGYFTADATKAIIERMIAPLLIGEVIDDVATWNDKTQRRLALFGRYGITIFAISGIDIALWDLKAKREGKPLFHLLGQQRKTSVPYYASLVRYGDESIAARVSGEALACGFKELKLHEITLPEIAACRDAAGPDIPISVDVNCNWSETFARDSIDQLIDLRTSWLEEPIFPPEDFAALKRLRGSGLAIAAGENWATSVQFQAALDAKSVDFAQPSVTKVGGVTEFLKIAEISAHAGIELLPHCPYFGPGFYASLHLAAALPQVRQLEYLFVTPEAWLSDIKSLQAGGDFTIPQVPGSGFEPSPEVLSRYARA
ncbi:mandelate racemase (plasmid) [Microvirga ossetica]|uniref:Mandelate racemase n=1 Tax=Microvirga ossetica TaxID=1882682 RepID=A0A1B2EVU1_9HYPH|nr:mandelate racemase/muconate lactonizing enzyme family protein [Microvirga ossetica]ANY84062.1 mandelate racemase [Microvirga ossetica]